MDAPTPAAEKAMPFEEALQKLEEVVRALENGEATLEESLAKYAQGVSLLRRCYEVLRVAEQTVKQMSEEDEQGKPIHKPFPNMAGRTEESEPRRRNSRPPDAAY